MLPLGCLPLWGREGVTLPAAEREKSNNGKIEDSKICQNHITSFGEGNRNEPSGI